MGYCGAVNIGHDEDLELWLYLEYHVMAMLVPVTKSELIEGGVLSEVLIFWARNGRQECRRVILVPSS